MGYSQQVHIQAREILERRRKEARQKGLDRRDEVLRRIPQIAEIELEMRRAAGGIIRAVALSPEKAGKEMQRLAEQNLAQQDLRQKLLLRAGYPPDYLAEPNFCRDCSDTGYQETAICHCLKDLLRDLAVKELSAGVQRKLFSDFDLAFYPDTPDGGTGVVPRTRMAEIFEYCKRYAATFSPGSPSLLLLGRTGLGKTHLSLAIAGEVVERGFGVLYSPVQKIVDRLEAEKFSYRQDAKERYAEISRTLLECDLLVLDDLGTEFVTPFTVSVLYNIVNTRLIEGRPTIVSTNLEPQEIEARYSQRMLSRLMLDYKALQFCGTDVRYLRRAGQGR